MQNASSDSPHDSSPASERLRPCPGCDAAKLDPVEALALGAFLGEAFNRMAVLEAMCAAHRGPFLRGTMLATTPERVGKATYDDRWSVRPHRPTSTGELREDER